MYILQGCHVIHDKILEDQDTDFEWDSKRDIIEDLEAG
jgi:hypothetical protein